VLKNSKILKKMDNNKIIVSVIKENKGMQTPATYTVKI
jgi:hypothetical protein